MFLTFSIIDKYRGRDGIKNLKSGVGVTFSEIRFFGEWKIDNKEGKVFKKGDKIREETYRNFRLLSVVQVGSSRS